MPPIEAPKDEQQPATVETPATETPEDEFAGLDAAMAAAVDDDLPPLPTPEPKPPEGADAKPTEEAAKPDAAKPAEAEKPAEAAPAKPEAAADKPEEQPDDVEAEIKALGISNEKTAERFRELSKRPKEEDVAPIREQAEMAKQWQDVIGQSGLTADQVGYSLATASDAVSGDPVRMNAAYERMQADLQALGKHLGREAPGVDPLAEHPDLKAEIDSGDLTHERALEVARSRAATKRFEEHGQRQAHADTERRAYESAMTAINTLNARLKASDPQFLQKLPYLTPALATIKQSLPPDKWATAVEEAYNALPDLPQPTPAPKPSAMPIRATGSGPAMQRAPKDDMEAFEMGVASAR